jgi:hypothetical protein
MDLFKSFCGGIVSNPLDVRGPFVLRERPKALGPPRRRSACG